MKRLSTANAPEIILFELILEAIQNTVNNSGNYAIPFYYSDDKDFRLIENLQDLVVVVKKQYK